MSTLQINELFDEIDTLNAQLRYPAQSKKWLPLKKRYFISKLLQALLYSYHYLKDIMRPNRALTTQRVNNEL